MNQGTEEQSSQSYLSLGVYPELLVAAAYKKNGIFFYTNQILDAASLDKTDDNTLHLDIYRLTLGGYWRFHNKFCLSLSYRHNFGFMSWVMNDSLQVSSLRMFGHAPCFYGDIAFLPSTKLHTYAEINVPLPLSLKGNVDLNETPVSAKLPMPLSLEAGVRFFTDGRFRLFLAARYTFGSLMDSLRFETDGQDSLGFHALALYDRDILSFKAEAAYRLIEPLELRLLGEYSPSGFSRLDTLWPDPGSLDLGVEGLWSHGAWDFSLLLGTQKFHPLSSQSGETVDGNSIVLRLGVARRI